MTAPTDPARDDAQTTDPTAPVEAQETMMPDEKPPQSIAPVPPTPPGSPRSSEPLPAVPQAVQVADKVSEAIGAIVIGALAWHHVLGGELAAGAIVLLLTGNTGLRTLGPRGVGIAGLLLLAVGGALGLIAPHAPAVADAAAAVARRG